MVFWAALASLCREEELWLCCFADGVMGSSQVLNIQAQEPGAANVSIVLLLLLIWMLLTWSTISFFALLTER